MVLFRKWTQTNMTLGCANNMDILFFHKPIKKCMSKTASVIDTGTFPRSLGEFPLTQTPRETIVRNAPNLFSETYMDTLCDHPGCHAKGKHSRWNQGTTCSGWNLLQPEFQNTCGRLIGHGFILSLDLTPIDQLLCFIRKAWLQNVAARAMPIRLVVKCAN